MKDDRTLGNRDLPLPLRVVGALSLLVALTATAILAADAVLLLTPPGCGEGSGCAEAARSVWARVPGVGWPVSVLAFSWFLAIGPAWVSSRRPARAFRWLVRLGALGSVGYLALLIAGGWLCAWCVALDESCNPAASSTRHEQACLAARAAEAAKGQAGADAFWRMLGWLLENRGGVTEETVGEAAPRFGLDRERLIVALRSPEVVRAIARQSEAARRLDIRFVPMV